MCCGCSLKSQHHNTSAKCQQCTDYWRCSCGCWTNKASRAKCEECQVVNPFTSAPSSSMRGAPAHTWSCCGTSNKIDVEVCSSCKELLPLSRNTWASRKCMWHCECGTENNTFRDTCQNCMCDSPFFQTHTPRQASGSRPTDTSPVKLVQPPVFEKAPHAPRPGDSEAAIELASRLGALYTGQQKPPESAFQKWITLPSPWGLNKSSEIQLVRVGPGQGLVFFPWGNHRNLTHPDWGEEYSIRFRHHGSAGQHDFILQPGDMFIMCPMKYPWPVCVWCCKFLFPVESHRSSTDHGPKTEKGLRECNSQAALEAKRKFYSPWVIAKHAHGVQF